MVAASADAVAAGAAPSATAGLVAVAVDFVLGNVGAAGEVCAALSTALANEFLVTGFAFCATANVIAAAPTITATKRITMLRAELVVIDFCWGSFFMRVLCDYKQSTERVRCT